MGIPIEDGFQIIDMGEIVRQKVTAETAVEGSKIEYYNDKNSTQN